jgi:putative SOS response-associated peptidase YedK
MINYGLKAEKSKISAFLGALPSGEIWTAQAEVKPGESGLVLRYAEPDLWTGGHRLELRRFGLVPQSFTSPDEADRYKKWFARAETWQRERNQAELWHQRCLIPMTHYFEERIIGGVPVRCEVIFEGKPLVAVAGIWSNWRKPARDVVSSFAMLTIAKDPLNLSGPRTPIVIEQGHWDAWLNPASKRSVVNRLLEPADPRRMDSIPLVLHDAGQINLRAG